MKPRALLTVVVLWTVGCPAIARAYPQYQLSSGTTRCDQCHLSPAGGGLLREWGQEEFGDTLARGGDGRFLHGAVKLPEWLSIGGDLRLAALANEVGASNGTELAVFPMQADLSVRAGSGAWSVIAVVGARGAVRSGTPTSSPNPASEVMVPSLASYVVSREHYVLWQPEEVGAYVRRFLGYNLLEETYGVGGGLISEAVELHVTAFAYDPVQYAARHEVGAAASIEAHPDHWFTIGSSARVGVSSVSKRIEAGVHAKLWHDGAKLLFQSEADAVHESFDAGAARWQLAAYAGPVWIPTRGVYAGVAYEAFAEDLHVRGVLRQAADVWLSLLPRAHFEIMMSGRAQRVGPGEHAYLGLLQLHYTI